MRLFIAVNFDDSIKDSLCKTMTELKKQGVDGNFSNRDNLHLTLVFIGETNRLNDIKSIMDSIVGQPFSLSICGLGTFKRDRGDILWSGVRSGSMLFTIQSKLTKALVEKGFDIEERPYNPHLTLCRKTVFPKDSDRDVFANILPEINTEINHVSLMKSERINGTLVYSEIYYNILI